MQRLGPSLDKSLSEEVFSARLKQNKAGRWRPEKQVRSWVKFQVASLARERASLNRSIGVQEARLGAARRTVAELDRPLVRRRHRDELDTARHQLEGVPRSIAGDRAKLARLDVEESHAAERLLKAVKLAKTRPELIADRLVVGCQLDRDARVRGELLAAAPSAHVIERPGPVPLTEVVAALWLDAAGRVAQHDSAMSQTGATLLDRQSRPVGDDVFASSSRAAAQAVERLDRALGRQPKIEPPHRSLGMSL